MTNAAKKAAATRADQTPETPTGAVAAAPSADPTPPPPAKKTAAKPTKKLDLAEEQRTANLIAVLGLDKAAWADLFAAGVDAEDGPVSVAQAVAERLGLIEVA